MVFVGKNNVDETFGGLEKFRSGKEKGFYGVLNLIWVDQATKKLMEWPPHWLLEKTMDEELDGSWGKAY